MRDERLKDIKCETQGRVGQGRGDVKYRDTGDAGCEWLSQKSEVLFLLFEQMSLLMYDVHNNLAPDNIKNMFTKLSSVHSYRTRSVTNENITMLNKLELKIWSKPSLFPVL